MAWQKRFEIRFKSSQAHGDGVTIEVYARSKKHAKLKAVVLTGRPMDNIAGCDKHGRVDGNARVVNKARAERNFADLLKPPPYIMRRWR